ncbi:MAG: aminotransferase class I/II-fold pyridoxal phosphate-dependent enzyme [Planctomycetes bacterium]|nr:aminotransferase class I/II-fold pyridoxal phosphate-dependent enzyme [Planctomycetota bacterium]
MTRKFDPIASMAGARHEFGEHGGVNVSIEASTTFTVMAAELMPRIFHGEGGPFSRDSEGDTGGCYLYGRHFNPTVFNLGTMLAAMEGTEAGYATSSGMGAISCSLLHLCNAGDRIVASNTLYGGTFALMKDLLPLKCGIETTFVPIDDTEVVEAMIREKRPKVLFAETLSNPTLRVPDLPRLAEIAHRHDVTFIVDNTFTPLILSPAQHGADVVIHSLTKFVSGASDVIAGAVCASRDLISSMMDLHTGPLMLLGPTMDPKIAHELTLRVSSLGLRMQEHSRRAQTFAERLRELGAAVEYPGLPDHEQHGLMRSLMDERFGFGGIFTIDLGNLERANQFMEILQNEHSFGFMAVSLGYFETLMSCSGSSTSSEMAEEDQVAAGISPGLVRMSVGITGTIDQRWEQLEDAARRVGVANTVPA